MLAAAGLRREVDGTTTNLEGRVSRLTQKVTAAGHGPPRLDDRRRARRPLGADLGLESVEEIWDEIERGGPVATRVTRRRSLAAGQDGVAGEPDPTRSAVPGRRPGAPRRTRSAPSTASTAARSPATPPAAAAGRPGRRAGEDAGASGRARRATSRPARPRPRPVAAAARPPTRPPLRYDRRAGPRRRRVDAYSLRLVATRQLYDQGTLVQHSPSLAGLAPGTACASTRTTSTASASPRATVSGSRRPHRRSSSAGRRRRVPGRGRRRRSTSPAPTAAELIDAGARSPTIRVETLGRVGDLMGDPLFADGVDWGVVGSSCSRPWSPSPSCWSPCILMIWFERKVIADMQNRIGPNRPGRGASSRRSPTASSCSSRRTCSPTEADRGSSGWRPYLSVVPAFLVFSIVPSAATSATATTAPSRSSATTPTSSSPTRPSASCSCWPCRRSRVYGVMLAGWSSGSKYPLLGSVRASGPDGHLRGRPRPVGGAVVLAAGSLSTHDIVARPAAAGGFPDWNVIATGVVPFVIFLIAGTAELNRPPFDLVEAEQELVGGFHTEYSSIRFALFYLAEFMNTVTMSAIIVTLFLGGPAGPLLFGPDWIWGRVWFFAKLVIFLFVFVWFRATLPRFRYDQLMDLGWKGSSRSPSAGCCCSAASTSADDEDWNAAATSCSVAIASSRRRRRLLAGHDGAVAHGREARRSAGEEVMV